MSLCVSLSLLTCAKRLSASETFPKIGLISDLNRRFYGEQSASGRLEGRVLQKSLFNIVRKKKSQTGGKGGGQPDFISLIQTRLSNQPLTIKSGLPHILEVHCISLIVNNVESFNFGWLW